MTNSIQNPDLEPRSDGRIPVDMVCLIDTLAANVPSLLKDLTTFVRPALWVLPGYELAPLRVVHHIFSKECEYFETRWDWGGLYSSLDSTMKRQAIKSMALYERTFRGDTPSVDEWKAMYLSAREVAEDRRTASSLLWLLKERLLRLKRADVQQGTSEYREWWREFHRSPLIPMMWRTFFGALVASGCAFALYRHWIAAVLCVTASYIPHLRVKIATHTRKIITASVHAESSLVVSAALAGMRWAQREKLSREAEQPGVLGGSEFAKTVESAIEFSVAKEIECHEEIQRLAGHWFEESRPLGDERLAKRGEAAVFITQSI